MFLRSPGVTDENYLRGVQIADAAGRVRFTSIFVACYAGRWPHIHFEVYPDRASITDSTKAIATSQVALPEGIRKAVYAQPDYEASVINLARVTLQSDNVFGDDAGASQLATAKGDVSSGYAVSVLVGVDTTTVPAAGGAPQAGGPGLRIPTSSEMHHPSTSRSKPALRIFPSWLSVMPLVTMPTFIRPSVAA